MDDKKKRTLAIDLIRAKGVELRDVAAGDEPFLYSSGNRGPGYVSIKGMVSEYALMHGLVDGVAELLVERGIQIDFVAGNMTGGAIPGNILHEKLRQLLGQDIRYVYVRGTRKLGGHGELITGIQNPWFKPGMRALVVEELVNFATTTTNSAIALREAGFIVEHAATILAYDHEPARQLLRKNAVELTHLFTLSELIAIIREEQLYPEHVIRDFEYLREDPPGWHAHHGFEMVGG